MANGKIRFGKQSGGELTLVIPDGVSNTNLVLPESGTVATQAYADGKTTLVQVQAEISTGSNLVTSPTGAIGYGTGAGGTVTQLTSKSTTVTLNKPSGRITMNNSAFAAGASVFFAVNNNLVTTSDHIVLTMGGVTTNTNYTVFPTFSVGNGIFYVMVKNISTGSLSEALVINFTVIKGATS